MLHISRLFIYPIKSLGGIEVLTAKVTDRGFEFDRRWMLVDSQNRFLSQREHAQMALLKPSILSEGLKVTHSKSGSSVIVPFRYNEAAQLAVSVWDDTCMAYTVGADIDAWFSNVLGIDCKLVYMPDDTKRAVDQRYAKPGQVTSFSDAYPFLIIGQSSLDDLNSRLPNELPMDRFRPNIVFTGAEPYYEDVMNRFDIGNIEFNGVKLCARCVVTTIDQEEAIKGIEPLKTLATYRRKNNKIYFGQNLVHRGEGTINVGDEITLKKLKELIVFE
jgi:uncharacterized protein YcbX